MIHRYFAALFLLSPLVVLTNLPFPYTLPRWIFITILCTVWSLFLVSDVIKKTVAPLTRIDIAFSFFVLVLAAATFFSVDPLHSMWGSLERSFAFSLWPALLIAHFGLKQSLLQQDDKTFLFRFFAATVAAAALWGIFQKIVPGFSTTFSGARIGGTLGNAIFFGSYLTLSIGVLAVKIFEEKKYSSWWYLFAASITLSVVSLFLTQTRGPLVGLFAGVASALAAYIVTTRPYKRAIVIGSASLFLAAAAFGIFAFKTNIITTTTISTRLHNWSMAWNGFTNRPILGWGPENFSLAADKYFEPKLAEYSIAETHADKPHNYFLEIAVTSGIFGIFAYLFLLLTASVAARSIHQTPREFSLLLGILIAAAVQNLSSFETHGSVIIFVFVLAYISTRLDSVATKKIQLPLFLTLAFSVILIVTQSVLPTAKDSSNLHTLITLNTDYQTEHESIIALQTKIATTPFPLDYFTTLSHAIVGQYWQNPTGFDALTQKEKQLHDADILWLRATISEMSNKYSNSGLWKSALANSAYQLFSLTKNSDDAKLSEKIYTGYAAISPQRQEPLLQIGQLALLQNNPEKALTFFDAAIALNPEYKTPHWQKTLTLFALKKHADAWSELSYLMSVNFEIKPPQVANYIYNQLLGNALHQEAESFRTYFEAGSF
jgi:O-antigen ligase